MVGALFICSIFLIFVWLIFFQFKLLKFSIMWGIISVLIFVHLLLIFLVGMRFMTPSSATAKMVQYTIQLTPRLPQPTMVAEVLVTQNMSVKKGQPLFKFDRRPYEFQVKQLQAKLAEAKQDVKILKTDAVIAQQKIVQAQSELAYATYQEKLTSELATQGAGPSEEAQKTQAQVMVARATVIQAKAEAERAELRYNSQINGVNTSVAAIEAELQEAQYFLDNTTMYAPEDGRVFNLQVRPGMIAGDVRFGAIASFICDNDRYLLASYFQENLKYVKPNQKVEVALDLYPGQIFKAHVDSIWQGSGAGQFLPSGTMPQYEPASSDMPQGQFAVKIIMDDPDQKKFPIGAQGVAAIYTESEDFAFLRKITIRAQSWFNWLYPLNV